MAYYLLVFVAGFAGSFHCLGMCGGFARALGRDTSGRHTLLARQLLYNTGRLATYAFLGLLAGTAGALLGGHSRPGSLDLAQRLLAQQLYQRNLTLPSETEKRNGRHGRVESSRQWGTGRIHYTESPWTTTLKKRRDWRRR